MRSTYTGVVKLDQAEIRVFAPEGKPKNVVYILRPTPESECYCQAYENREEVKPLAIAAQEAIAKYGEASGRCLYGGQDAKQRVSAAMARAEAARANWLNAAQQLCTYDIFLAKNGYEQIAIGPVRTMVLCASSTQQSTDCIYQTRIEHDCWMTVFDPDRHHREGDSCLPDKIVATVEPEEGNGKIKDDDGTEVLETGPADVSETAQLLATLPGVSAKEAAEAMMQVGVLPV